MVDMNPLQNQTAPVTFPPGKQYGFFFDQGRCIACDACAIACQEWNGLPVNTATNQSGKWMRVYQWESGAFPTPRIWTLAIPCYHCQNPVCVDAANGAMYKESKYGAVLIDPAKAKTQGPDLRAANEACPYGAIVFDSDAQTATGSKCTMCIDRLEQGLGPMCVFACDAKAYDFGTLEELQNRYGTLRQLEGMPDPSIAQPSVVLKAQIPRKQIVPYDSNRALQLWQQRGPNAMTGTFPNPFEVCTPSAPPVFQNASDVTDPQNALLQKNKLVLKHPNNASLDFYTRKDE